MEREKRWEEGEKEGCKMNKKEEKKDGENRVVGWQENIGHETLGEGFLETKYARFQWRDG